MNTLLSAGKRLAAAAPLLVLLFLTASCSRFNATGGLSLWGYILLALDILAFLDIFR